MAKKPNKFGGGGMTTMEKRIAKDDVPTRPLTPPKKPAPKKPAASASPPLPNWMIRGDNEDKAPGERGAKKYAKGGSVKRLAVGGLGSLPTPQQSNLPFKGAPTPMGMPAQGQPIKGNFNDTPNAPQMGGPGGPQMRGGPGPRPTMHQRPMMGGQGGPPPPPTSPTGKTPSPGMPPPMQGTKEYEAITNAKAMSQPYTGAPLGTPYVGGVNRFFNDSPDPGSKEYEAITKTVGQPYTGPPIPLNRPDLIPEDLRGPPMKPGGYKKGGTVKKFAKGGKVKKLAVGGPAAPPAPPTSPASTLPFKGTPTPPPAPTSPAGRSNPGMQHSNMPQRQAPNPRMANMRANAANQITKLKQEQLRQQVWGPGSANSLNPKPAAPAAPPAAAAEPEHDDMAAYRTYQANGGAAGAEARARGYNKGGKAKKFAKGGAVKAYAKGGTVKKSGASRGDGCAQRGHTKGKMK